MDSFITINSNIHFPPKIKHPRYTVSNKKNTLSCFLYSCFSRISPEPLELQKSYLHLFASLSNELSDLKKAFFKSGQKISGYLQKRCFARKKQAIGKNPPF